MKIIILITFLLVGCNTKHNNKASKPDADYFDLISRNDVKLQEPVRGQWRFEHHESHQSFDDYKKAAPKKAVYGETKIYLQPLGSFTEDQNKIIASTRAYLEIFFQLETVALDAMPDEIIPDSAKRTRDDGSIQIYTPYILNKILKGKIPADGYALMAISEKDIYPSPDWNFVFGIASYADRVGVTSIARLQSTGDDLLCLRRLFTIASHEIGHMFSIHHCVIAECAMNGSNNLYETDQCVSRLCSECQRKLYWNINYDNRKRLNELISYFKENKLAEDLKLAEGDYKLLKQ